MSLKINNIHHIAIICSDYRRSLHFYTSVLGFEVLQETYREARCSYKADLALNGTYCIELFSFPNPPQRLSYPEATGLRHLAFEVNDVATAQQDLHTHLVATEPIRLDELTGKKFFFINDPDGLPIEFYEK